VVVALVVVAAATAYAETAKQTYQRGLDLYAAGNYDGAAAAFVQAHAMRPKPVILFNIAQAYRKGGHFPDALKYYKQFLDEAPAAEKAPLEDETKKYVAEIEAQEALQRSLIEKADREEAAKLETRPPPPPKVPPPPPKVESAPPPKVESAPPPKSEPAPPPKVEPAPPLAVSTTVPEKKSDKPPLYKRWWLWTGVAAVVVVGVGVGLGVGLGNQSNGPGTALGTREPKF